MVQKYLEVGKIVGTRGLNGEIKIKVLCDSPELFCRIQKFYLDCGNKILDISSMRIYNLMVLAFIEGVNTINEVEGFVGKYIYSDRVDMPIDETRYFIKDLIGLMVIDKDTGHEYGCICDVFSTGSNDVYVVKSHNKKQYMIPAIDSVVTDIQIDKGKIFICPIEGIFDD